MQLSKFKSGNLKKYNSSWVRTEAIRYEPQRSDFHRIKQPWIKLCVSQPGTWVTVHDFTLHYHGSQRMAVIGSEKGVMGHWGHTELGLDTCEGSIAGLDGQRDIWRSTEWKLEREKEDEKYSNIEKKWTGSLAAFREVSFMEQSDRQRWGVRPDMANGPVRLCESWLLKEWIWSGVNIVVWRGDVRRGGNSLMSWLMRWGRDLAARQAERGTWQSGPVKGTRYSL